MMSSRWSRVVEVHDAPTSRWLISASSLNRDGGQCQLPLEQRVDPPREFRTASFLFRCTKENSRCEIPDSKTLDSWRLESASGIVSHLFALRRAARPFVCRAVVIAFFSVSAARFAGADVRIGEDPFVGGQQSQGMATRRRDEQAIRKEDRGRVVEWASWLETWSSRALA